MPNFQLLAERTTLSLSVFLRSLSLRRWLGGPRCAAAPAEPGHLAIEAVKVVLPGHHDAITPGPAREEHLPEPGMPLGWRLEP